MDDSRKLAEDIKTGKYFENSLKWHQLKYQHPIVERSHLILILLLVATAFFLCFLAVARFHPTSRFVPYMVAVNNVENKEVVAVKLAKHPEENRDIATIRYHVQDFIQAREAYDPSNLNASYLRVEAITSPDYFIQYLEEMSLNNPNSPRIKFENRVIRDIFIQSTTIIGQKEFEEENIVPKQAIVTFTATHRSNTMQIPNESFRALVEFSYTPFVVDQTDNKVTPYEFQIINYRYIQ